MSNHLSAQGAFKKRNRSHTQTRNRSSEIVGWGGEVKFTTSFQPRAPSLRRRYEGSSS